MLTRADADCSVKYVNPAFTELTGYRYDEVVGKDPSILHGPKTDRKLMRQLRETIESVYVSWQDRKLPQRRI